MVGVCCCQGAGAGQICSRRMRRLLCQLLCRQDYSQMLARCDPLVCVPAQLYEWWRDGAMAHGAVHVDHDDQGN